MTLARALQVAAGNSQESADIAEAIDFDGSNDSLIANSLTGAADSKTFTLSAWVWLNSVAQPNIGAFIYTAGRNNLGTHNFQVEVKSGGDIEITARADGSTTFILNVTVPAGSVPISTFMHVLISFDMANTANRYVYINDVAVTPTYTTYTNTNLLFATNTFRQVVGSSWTFNTVNQATNGRLSNVFLDYTYRNLSIEANRRLFVTADLKPADGQAALNPILYLPMSDPTAPGVNAGTGGNFTLTGTVARSGRGPNQYNAPYSDLDGSADFLSRTTAPTGIANGKQFTISYVAQPDTTGENFIFSIATSTTHRFYIGGNSGAIQIFGSNSSGTNILLAESASAQYVPNRNVVVTISIDLTDTAKRHFYVNGVAISAVWPVYTNNDIQFNVTSTPNYRVGCNAGTTEFNGRLGALWFNTSYIDLSVATSLAKFVTGTGIDAKPVDLGATGELPTGTSPIIYLPMYGNNAGKNYGTGGDFTVNSGPYTGARGPNEYWASAVGNTGFLFRNTPLSGATDTKTLTFFALFKPTSVGVTRSFWYVADVASSSFVAQIQVNGGNFLSITFRNSSGATVLTATLTNNAISNTDLTYAIHCSVDLSDTAKRSVYVNGALASVTWSTYTNNTMYFSAQRSAFGAEWGATWSGSVLRGILGGFYLNNAYIDFTQEANRLLFADAFNRPTNLPAAIAAGTVPTPLIYMLFDPANNGANSGTGGNYTNSSMSDGGQL